LTPGIYTTWGIKKNNNNNNNPGDLYYLGYKKIIYNNKMKQKATAETKSIT